MSYGLFPQTRHFVQCSKPRLFLRHLNLAIVDRGNDIRRMLAIHSAAHRTRGHTHCPRLLASSEHLLHGSSELVRVGTLTQNLRHLNDLIESDVSIVLNYG